MRPYEKIMELWNENKYLSEGAWMMKMYASVMIFYSDIRSVCPPAHAPNCSGGSVQLTVEAAILPQGTTES